LHPCNWIKGSKEIRLVLARFLKGLVCEYDGIRTYGNSSLVR